MDIDAVLAHRKNKATADSVAAEHRKLLDESEARDADFLAQLVTGMHEQHDDEMKTNLHNSKDRNNAK